MKTIPKAATCLSALLLSACCVAEAQWKNVPRYQFGLHAGVYVYQGDLTPSDIGSYRTLKPVIHLFASRLVSSSFAWRVNLAAGSVKGDDAKYLQPEYRRQRNFRFVSPVIELTVLAEWNILGRNYTSRGLAPYFFAGGGISLVNIKRDYSRLNAEYFGDELMSGLASDVERRPPSGLLVLPVGAGARYYLSDKIGLIAETSYRIMSNDYLDGFSRAANPDKGDHYYSHSIGIVYSIGKINTLACPVIRY